MSMGGDAHHRLSDTTGSVRAKFKSVHNYGAHATCCVTCSDPGTAPPTNDLYIFRRDYKKVFHSQLFPLTIIQAVRNRSVPSSASPAF